MAMSEQALSSRCSNILLNKRDSFTDENYGHYPKDEFIRIWEKEVDAEFQKASKSNPNFDISPPAGSLNFGFADTPMGLNMCMNIAMGTMTYWAKAIVPASPAHLNVVIAVSNDAIAHALPLYNDILSIRTNNGLDGASDFMLRIHSKIMTHVRNIKWTVVEMDSKGNIGVFTETVS